MVPNGVIIVDMKLNDIAFANREMETIVGQIQAGGLKDRIQDFHTSGKQVTQERSCSSSKQSQSEISSQTSAISSLNLWEYLITSESKF